MASLPDELSSEEEQLKIIEQLQAENDLAQKRLDTALKDAEVCQRRVAEVLRDCCSKVWDSSAPTTSDSSTSLALSTSSSSSSSVPISSVDQIPTSSSSQ
jgi:hypothetical protein